MFSAYSHSDESTWSLLLLIELPEEFNRIKIQIIIINERIILSNGGYWTGLEAQQFAVRNPNVKVLHQSFLESILKKICMVKYCERSK